MPSSSTCGMLPLSDSMNGRQIVVLYDPVFDGSFTNSSRKIFPCSG